MGTYLYCHLQSTFRKYQGVNLERPATYFSLNFVVWCHHCEQKRSLESFLSAPLIVPSSPSVESVSRPLGNKLEPVSLYGNLTITPLCCMCLHIYVIMMTHELANWSTE